MSVEVHAIVRIAAGQLVSTGASYTLDPARLVEALAGLPEVELPRAMRDLLAYAIYVERDLGAPAVAATLRALVVAAGPRLKVTLEGRKHAGRDALLRSARSLARFLGGPSAGPRVGAGERRVDVGRLGASLRV